MYEVSCCPFSIRDLTVTEKFTAEEGLRIIVPMTYFAGFAAKRVAADRVNSNAKESGCCEEKSGGKL